jgi:chorismate mutase-like protein
MQPPHNDPTATGLGAATRTSAAGAGANAAEPANGLAPFRTRLDELDEQIARLLGERFDICREVARYKSEHDIAMMQPDRVQQVRARYLARGAEVGLPADFTESLFDLLIGATCKLEDELMDAAKLANTAAVGDGSPRR